MVFDPVIGTLFNDAPQSMHAQLLESHIPHAIKAFITPVLPPLWSDPALKNRRVWLISTLDVIFPATVQRSLAAASGVDWSFEEVEAGHCAFITKPQDVAKVIFGAARRWG